MINLSQEIRLVRFAGRDKGKGKGWGLGGDLSGVVLTQGLLCKARGWALMEVAHAIDGASDHNLGSELWFGNQPEPQGPGS